MVKNVGLKNILKREEYQINPVGVELKKEILNILLPRLSWQRRVIKKILFGVHLKRSVTPGYYNAFLQQKRCNLELNVCNGIILDSPLISIVVPAYNTPRRYLNDLIYSIMSQTYENWELILVNASTKVSPSKNIDDCANKDRRIKVIKVDNYSIYMNKKF